MGTGLGDAVGSAPVREPDRVDGPGSGEPASRDKRVGSAYIESTPLPPLAEREWVPDYAREAVAALRHAKAYSPEQAPLLKPWAIMATDSYYALANETLEEAGREARTAEREWDNAPKDPQKRGAYQLAKSNYNQSLLDSLEADRLGGQARETPRSIAEDADDKERAASHNVAPTDLNEAPGPADGATPEQHAKYVRYVKAAAQDRVFKWENAFSNAVMRGDSEEIEICGKGLGAAIAIFNDRLNWK
jgi:hypothetical protein